MKKLTVGSADMNVKQVKTLFTEKTGVPAVYVNFDDSTVTVWTRSAVSDVAAFETAVADKTVTVKVLRSYTKKVAEPVVAAS